MEKVSLREVTLGPGESSCAVVHHCITSLSFLTPFTIVFTYEKVSRNEDQKNCNWISCSFANKLVVHVVFAKGSEEVKLRAPLLYTSYVSCKNIPNCCEYNGLTAEA